MPSTYPSRHPPELKPERRRCVTPFAQRLSCSIACIITLRTASGFDAMMTCEPSTSVVVAFARLAIDLTTSVPAALSPVATTDHDGSFLHAGGPEGSEKASA